MCWTKSRKKKGAKQKILLRLTASVDAHTHRLIQTGRTDTKFGMNMRGGGARSGVEKALTKENLELVGLSQPHRQPDFGCRIF